jgi:DNA-binding transcriptional ArsR family regulator
MSTPLSVSNNDITSQLAAGPQSVEELCRSMGRAHSLIENRLDMLLAAGVVCVDPRGRGEARYMLTTKGQPTPSGPIGTSIAGARYAPSTASALTGYSEKMREFCNICMLARR